MSNKRIWVVGPEVHDWIHNQYSLTAINDGDVHSSAHKSPRALQLAIKRSAREAASALDEDLYRGMYTMGDVMDIVFVEVCEYYEVWMYSEDYGNALKRVTRERQEVKVNPLDRPTQMQLDFLHQYVISEISGGALEKMREYMKQRTDYRRPLSNLLVSEMNRVMPGVPACLSNFTRHQIIDIVMLMLMTGADMQCGSGVHEMYTHLVSKYGPITIYDNAVSAAQTETNEANQQESENMNETTNRVGAPQIISNAAFETRHFVNGRDVKGMTDNELIEAIRRLENEIADLKTVKTKSKAITKKIEELGDMLSKTVEILDARA